MQPSKLVSVIATALWFVLGVGSFAADVVLNGHTFSLPDGFVIELVAGPPLVNRPISADFDERGRLYVTDSSGSNDKVEKQLEEKPHRIVRLEDTDGDGRFDRSVVFADKLMFPEGMLCHGGSVYVAAPPSIWKLTDTNNDGQADQREEWFVGKTLTGCANDLHGPYLGPDGWIYWCKGAFAKQTYERVGKALRPVSDVASLPMDKTWTTRASHIFRCRPDGSGLEQVMTGGMDNPVEIAFMPNGDRIFSTTFLQNPGGGKRDGLIHAIYGGVYGKIHDVIEDHPRTGDVMPVLSQLGPAAPCGLTRYTSRGLGDGFQNNLFCTCFNLRKVTRHVLTPYIASYKSQDEDFLVSSNVDFHPTDVLESPDGSLLVIDTGGWYKLCCPTSQLWKPDVLGAIYRIRAKDRSPQAKTPPTDKESPEQAAWSFVRRGDDQARTALRALLTTAPENVQQIALHGLSLWRDEATVPQAIELLKGDSLTNRRLAAEILGRCGDKRAVAPLLAAAAEPHDRHLEHALTYALIEIADPQQTAAGLAAESPHTRRVALLALNQMSGGGLDPKIVAPLLASSNATLKETAQWIVGRHPEWGDALAEFLKSRLIATNLSAEDTTELTRQLATFSKQPAVTTLLADVVRNSAASASARRIALVAMAQSNIKEMPNGWLAALTVVLTSADEETLRLAINVVRTLPLPKAGTEDLFAAVRQHGLNPNGLAAFRLEALAALSGNLGAIDSSLFNFLTAHLGTQQSVATRAATVEILAKAKLTNEQLVKLLEAFQEVGPLEIDRLCAAFEQTTDEKLGLQLIMTLKAAPAIAGLRVDALKSRVAKYSPAVQKQAEELYSLLNVDLEKQRARLEELTGKMSGGDVRRGHAVFNSAKAACSACHQMGYVGGNIGPDLSRIGQIRTERDLLEAIAFPNASFVRSYEPLVAVLNDGTVVSGVLRKDSADEIVLAISAKEERRISRTDIEELQPGKVSVMPSGLDQQLTTQELADLIAFLKGAK